MLPVSTLLIVWAALGPTVPVPPPAAVTFATTSQGGPLQPSTTPVPAPPPEWRPRRYGDRGTSEVALALAYSSLSGFLGGGGFRHFVVDGLAPGVEATYISGGTRTAQLGMAFGTLRLVPIRTPNLALVLTGRAGRVFLADHQDGWGAGGGGGVIVFLGGSGNVGLEIGYEALRLLPASFCADLRSCVIHGPVFGLRISF